MRRRGFSLRNHAELLDDAGWNLLPSSKNLRSEGRACGALSSPFKEMESNPLKHARLTSIPFIAQNYQDSPTPTAWHTRQHPLNLSLSNLRLLSLSFIPISISTQLFRNALYLKLIEFGIISGNSCLAFGRW